MADRRLNSGLRSVQVSIEWQTQRIQAHVKTLRPPVPNGEPCEDPESERGTGRLGVTPYLCRIFRIPVSDRVDLAVGCSGVKVGFQEGLEIGIGALGMKLSPCTQVSSL